MIGDSIFVETLGRLFGKPKLERFLGPVLEPFPAGTGYLALELVPELCKPKVLTGSITIQKLVPRFELAPEICQHVFNAQHFQIGRKYIILFLYALWKT